MAVEKEMARQIDLGLVNAVLVVLLIAILLVNISVLYSVANRAATPISEPPKKQVVTVTFVNANNCTACPDITLLTEALTKKGLSVTTKTVLADQAKEAIATYALTRLPAAVISGEIKSLASLNLRNVNSALVYEPAAPPFVNATTGALVGTVNIIALEDAACLQCSPAKATLDQLTNIGVLLKSTFVDAGTPQGSELIAKYNISKVPTIIMSSDALLYPAISQVWKDAGTIESDGMLVLRAVSAPYQEPATHVIRGLVDITYVTDASCAECYNVSIHDNILSQNFRMYFGNKKTIDVGTPEGKAFIAAYNITKVPTIVLSPESKVYAGIQEIWSNVGTVAPDGSYVFTAIEQLKGQVYKNLKTGTIVGKTNATVSA